MSEKEIKILTATGCVDIERENEILMEINKDLVKRIKKQNEIIDKAIKCIKLYGKYNGEECTRGFKMMTADFNKLLQILEDEEVE